MLTATFEADLAATYGDPSAFSELIFGTTFHDGQISYCEKAKADLNFLLPGNSWGKTEFIVRYSFYLAWFKEGPNRPTTFTAWVESTYNCLLASFEYETIGESFDRFEKAYNNNDRAHALIADITKSPRGKIVLTNGSTIDFGTLKDNGKHVEATRYNVIFVDEAGHIPDISYTYDSVLYPRTMGVSGRVHFIGTPKPHSDPYLLEVFEKGRAGDDPFYFSYSGSVLENTFWTEDERVRVFNNPRYVTGWKPVQPNEELGILEQAVRKVNGKLCAPVLSPMGRQVILGAFVIAGGLFFNRFHVNRMFEWDSELPDYGADDSFAMPYVSGRMYAAAFDLAGNKQRKPGRRKGKGSDPTVGIVLDYTEKPWKIVAFYFIRGGDADWEDKYQLMHKVYTDYHLPYLIIDGTGNVDSVQEALQTRGVEVEGVHFGGSSNKKFDMLRNLQLCTEMEWSGSKGVLRSPPIPQLKYELEHYIIPDDDITQDCVMTLAMVANDVAQYELPAASAGECY